MPSKLGYTSCHVLTSGNIVSLSLLELILCHLRYNKMKQLFLCHLWSSKVFSASQNNYTKWQSISYRVLFSLPNNRSLERFSIECRNLAKTNITLANQKGHRQSSESMKTRSKLSWRKARENVCGQVMIGLKKWREIFKPITKCRIAKPIRIRITITLDTQVKTALSIRIVVLVSVVKR